MRRTTGPYRSRSFEPEGLTKGEGMKTAVEAILLLLVTAKSVTDINVAAGILLEELGLEQGQDGSGSRKEIRT